MVVHWLLVVIFDHTKYENVLESFLMKPLWSDVSTQYSKENKYLIVKHVITLSNVEIFLYYSYNKYDFALLINFDFVDFDY